MRVAGILRFLPSEFHSGGRAIQGAHPSRAAAPHYMELLRFTPTVWTNQRRRNQCHWAARHEPGNAGTTATPLGGCESNQTLMTGRQGTSLLS